MQYRVIHTTKAMIR